MIETRGGSNDLTFEYFLLFWLNCVRMEQNNGAKLAAAAEKRLPV